jgi:dynein heavy chain, axonemal
MSRLYGNQPKTFTLCIADREFRKAVFGLSWFHTIMTERKKFKTLGWNVSYAFNDSDYQVCEDSIANYMGRITEVPNSDYVKGKIPWQAIQYLIAECNYGGRITDDRDRRLIKVYAKEIFDENLVALDKWRPVGTEEFNYQYPADEANTKHPDIASIFTPDFFLQEIQKSMEVRDQPQAFGQHTNAEITSQILDTNELLYSILSLQPQQVSAAGKSPEEQTLDLIVPLRAGIPDSIDVAALKYKTRSDDSPLTVVLIQEI